MKSKWTTIFGVLAGLPTLLGAVGVGHFGHIGTLTIDQFIGGIGVLGVGALAKDWNVTGGTKQQ